jgi:hypothetical protein
MSQINFTTITQYLDILPAWDGEKLQPPLLGKVLDSQDLKQPS